MSSANFIKAVKATFTKQDEGIFRLISGEYSIATLYQAVKAVLDVYDETVLNLLAIIGITGDEATKVENAYKNWKSLNFHADGTPTTKEERKAKRDKKAAEKAKKATDALKAKGLVSITGTPYEIVMALMPVLTDDEVIKVADARVKKLSHGIRSRQASKKNVPISIPLVSGMTHADVPPLYTVQEKGLA